MAWHRCKGNSIVESKIAVTIVIGVLLGCVIIFTIQNRQISKSSFQINSSSEQIEMLKSEIAAMQETNSELKKQVEEYLTEKLQLVEQQKAGPFGTVKALSTNPTVTPDDSVNPRLANMLKKLAVQNELIVTLANSNVKDTLEVWFRNIKRVGIPNYLVIALDDQILELCKSNNVPVYKRDPDEVIDALGRTGGVGAVSTLKFTILREFLQLGYSVLMSDVDIIYLQNPFQHLIRDSDVESMTDGHDNNTAYGYDDIFDNSDMGWSRIVVTTRIWVYNCGFFYIRPTIPAIELLDRVTHRMNQQPNLWDQVVYNEELFFPSHPGYHGLYASKRTMDFYKFMNSKVLFKTVRKDINLKINLKPVIVHINYHPDKLARMKAVEEFYVNGKQDALDPFPDGSQ